MINERNIIAVCTSRIYDHQHQIFLERLNEYLKPYNCCVMIFTLNSDLYWWEDKYAPETYVFDIIPYNKLECVIIMDEKIKSRTVTERIIARSKKHSVPVVVIDGKYDGVADISFDYQKGFESVVRHVIEDHGVRRPHFMAGSKGNRFSDERLEIFRKVISENGIPFDDSMVSYGEFWYGPARTAAQDILDRGDLPEAVICANDVMAVNVCDIFVNAGVKIPEQVIVTGFDGIDEAMLSTPQLSTAGCDSEGLAEAVSTYIKDLLSGKKPHNMSVIPKLRPNASCGCVYTPSAYDSRMNEFNNRFYRYQDDIRMLYEISTKMQMAVSPAEASNYLRHYITHDMCCVVDRSCFDDSRNYFVAQETGDELCMFYDFHHLDMCGTRLKKDEFLPNIHRLVNTGYPLIFNAIDYMSKPFGFICYYYYTYDINEYTRTASITNTVSMGLGGFISMHHQKFLADKMTAELKAAAQMQKNMMPSDHDKQELYEISASMIPAKNVGGDFYDFFRIDDEHLALVMADVSGKGVPAALFMAVSKLVMHDRAMLKGTPAEILRDVNKQICSNNKMNLFVTIWFGILDLKTGIISYANAGHEYPAVKRTGGSFELIKSDNYPPVGATDDIEYEDLTIDISGGGSIFIYTDGVTDIKNEYGEHFGVERTIELLNMSKDDSPDTVLNTVSDGIGDFAGDTEQFDDTTMMCVYFKGI